MDDYPAEAAIHQRYSLLRPVLDERLRRLWAAAEAVALGTRGVAVVSRATGLSRSTIWAGIKQLEKPDAELMGLTVTGRVRKPGAGRKSTTEKANGIERDLECLMESRQEEERGPLAWTCKSLRTLAQELGVAGHRVSYRTVGNLLHRLGYRFGRSGDYKKWSLADRREGFRRISVAAASLLGTGEPVLSIRFQASPEAAAVLHLMMSGLLSWWRQSGLQQYPRARRILIAAERPVAGSAWTAPLEALAAEVRLEVAATHFPPGAWRWQRSARQVTCLLEGSAGAAEIGACLDLVLPGAGSS